MRGVIAKRNTRLYVATCRRVPCLCASCLINLDKEVIMGPNASALEKFATPLNCYFKESVEDWNEWTDFKVTCQAK